MPVIYTGLYIKTLRKTLYVLLPEDFVLSLNLEDTVPRKFPKLDLFLLVLSVPLVCLTLKFHAASHTPFLYSLQDYFIELLCIRSSNGKAEQLL